MLKFAVAGTEYKFEETLTLAEAMLVKTCTGLSAGQFMRGFQEMDGAALGAMVLLAKMRAGEDTTWADLASMDLVKLIESMGELNDRDALADTTDAESSDESEEPLGEADA